MLSLDNVEVRLKSYLILIDRIDRTNSNRA